MRKHKWAIIAGVCMIAFAVLGAVIIPGIFDSSPPPPVPKSREVVMPAHWWQISLTEKQVEILHDIWGTEVSVTQLLEAISLTTLDEMPEEVAAFVRDDTVTWTYESFEEWTQIQAMFFGHGSYSGKGSMKVDFAVNFYIGRSELDEISHSQSAKAP